MVNGVSRLSSSDPASPLSRTSPQSISTGASAAPAITDPTSQGASARVRGASAPLWGAIKNAMPAPR